MAIRFVTVLALITSVFSLVMAGPRVYARMADDGVFPSFFRFGGAGAPTAAIMAQAALAILLIVVSDLRGLLSYLGFTLSVSAALTVASLFLIAKREGRAAVAVWGYPFTPAFYVLATLILAALAGRRSPDRAADHDHHACQRLGGVLRLRAAARYGRPGEELQVTASHRRLERRYGLVGISSLL